MDIVEKAQFDVEENGSLQHPIDLIADRVFSRKKVEMNGRYPIPADMQTALAEAKAEWDSELQEIFGEQGQAILLALYRDWRQLPLMEEPGGKSRHSTH